MRLFLVQRRNCCSRTGHACPAAVQQNPFLSQTKLKNMLQSICAYQALSHSWTYSNQAESTRSHFVAMCSLGTALGQQSPLSFTSPIQASALVRHIFWGCSARHISAGRICGTARSVDPRQLPSYHDLRRGTGWHRRFSSLASLQQPSAWNSGSRGSVGGAGAPSLDPTLLFIS